MHKPIADAVEDVKAAFRGHEVATEELADGSVWVILHGIGIGDDWNRTQIDLRLKLQPSFPDTEPYPFYTEAGLGRSEGTQLAPIQSAVSIDGETWTQISLRNGAQPTLLPGESLGSRFQAVVRWLRNPQ